MSKYIKKIIDNIYIGTLETAKNERSLNDNNITAIINCINWNYDKFNHINYYDINLPRNPTQNDQYYLLENYYKIITFINTSISNNGNVLIVSETCQQRSPTIAAIYIIYKFKINPQIAIMQLRNHDQRFFSGNISYLPALQLISKMVWEIMNKLANSNNSSNNNNNYNYNYNNYNNRFNNYNNSQKYKNKQTIEKNWKLCIYGILSTVPFNPPIKVETDYSFEHKNLYKLSAKIDVFDTSMFDVLKNFTDNNYKTMVVLPTHYENMNFYYIDKPFTEIEKLMCISNYCINNKFNIKNLFPLKPDCGIYNDSVYVFRDNKYELLDDSFHISTLLISPINEPELYEGNLIDDDLSILLGKMELMFQTAYINKNDVIIFQNFGTDSFFKNPIHNIVSHFNLVVNKWKYCFKFIIFCIDNKYNTQNQYSYNNDYIYFSRYIKKYDNVIDDTINNTQEQSSINLQNYNSYVNTNNNTQEQSSINLQNYDNDQINEINDNNYTDVTNNDNDDSINNDNNYTHVTINNNVDDSINNDNNYIHIINNNNNDLINEIDDNHETDNLVDDSINNDNCYETNNDNINNNIDYTYEKDEKNNYMNEELNNMINDNEIIDENIINNDNV